MRGILLFARVRCPVVRKILRQEASPEECSTLLLDLSQALFKYHQKKVVLLIDEYDTPIHGAYSNSFYDEVVSFFRSFLSSALKDNAALFKGVITGILRIAKESLFSGLNNVVVYSLLRTEFSTLLGTNQLKRTDPSAFI